MKSLQIELDTLYTTQQEGWATFAEAVENLKNVKSKSIQIESSKLLLQNNSARIISTAAKIDQKSLAERPCFLCKHNRPVEQQEFPILGGKYVALVNPFPVLPKHFTVVSKEHVKQDILSSIEDFIAISFALDEKSILIFNGAKAGASAPDHLHFQIIPSAEVPISEAVTADTDKQDKSCEAIEFAGIGYLSFYAQNQSLLLNELRKALQLLELKSEHQLELINLMALRTPKGVMIYIAPRKSHRPSCFFAEGPAQIMISPAAIELSGVVVLPRFEDFEKITTSALRQVFKEVCWDKAMCDAFINELSCK